MVGAVLTWMLLALELIAAGGVVALAVGLWKLRRLTAELRRELSDR